jgi:signal transduction histidine kinase
MSARFAHSSSNHNFRALFETTPGSYVVLTPDFRIAAVNHDHLQSRMEQGEEILGRKIFELFSSDPEDIGSGAASSLAKSMEQVLRTRTPDAMKLLKHRIPQPESTGGGFAERPAIVINSPVLGSNGEVAYIIQRIEDLSNFIRSEQVADEERGFAETVDGALDPTAEELPARAFQFADTNRLRVESLDRMSGGIAHDFNNLLNIILGYTRLLKERVEDADRAMSGLSAIERAAETAAGLSRQLLALSRRQVPEPRVLDPNRIIMDIEPLIRRVIGNDIEFELIRNPEFGRVRVDLSEFERVIMRLVLNARSELAGRGRLLIEIKNVELDEAYVAAHPNARPGRYVGIGVRDIGAATREIQFRSPAASVGSEDEGTEAGVGLSAVYSIVKQSGGHVAVSTDAGLGTSFCVYLPQVSDPVEVAA